MADDVKLNISFDDGGDDSSSKNPFSGIKALSKSEIEANFPEIDNFKEIFANLKTVTAEDIFDSSQIGKSIEQTFKDLAEASFDSFNVAMDESIDKVFANLNELNPNTEAFDSSQFSFLPEDFEENLDSFFQSITDITEVMEEEREARDQAVEEATAMFETMVSDIGDTIGYISAWGEAIFQSIAIITGAYVATALYSAALREVIDSLGEYSQLLKIQQANTERELTLQSLRNSQRLGEQLAANESSRGELAQDLEQFKVELFDLLSPVIRFITITLSLILKAINLILAALNLIKDIITAPYDIIIALLRIISDDARDNLRRKRVKDRDTKNPGLGSAADLFELANLGLTTSGLPPGLQEDVVQHPFEFPGDNGGVGSGGGGAAAIGGGPAGPFGGIGL